VSAFLALYFELLDITFQGLTVCSSIYGVSSMHKIDEKRPLPVAKTVVKVLLVDVDIPKFMLMENGGGAIALIAALSQVYGETPTLVSCHCAVRKVVTFFLIAREKYLR
jgi:hypothetical protein